MSQGPMLTSPPNARTLGSTVESSSSSGSAGRRGNAAGARGYRRIRFGSLSLPRVNTADSDRFRGDVNTDSGVKGNELFALAQSFYSHPGNEFLNRSSSLQSGAGQQRGHGLFH
jgi:hypothetical protein